MGTTSVNTAIELHDSEVTGIAVQEGTVIVHFQPAYLHKSEGRPGYDAGTGWVQEARLILAAASVSGRVPDLPCPIWKGWFVVGEVKDDGLIGLPLDVTAPAELRMVFDDFHTVTVKARGVRLELVGEPRYVEDFKP